MADFIPEELEHLRALVRDPYDLELRLAYADWLVARGEKEKAAFLQAQIRCFRSRGKPDEHAALRWLRRLHGEVDQEWAEHVGLDTVDLVQKDLAGSTFELELPEEDIDFEEFSEMLAGMKPVGDDRKN